MGWEFPWTTSKSVAGMRAWEEIVKREGGDKKIEFTVSLTWVDEFDVFSTFRLQDPFAIDANGIGDEGHYYFIESISYDFGKEQMKIVAIDLGWLQRLGFILGDEETDPPNWEDATKDERRKGFLGDERTGRFADRREAKRIIRRERRRGGG